MMHSDQVKRALLFFVLLAAGLSPLYGCAPGGVPTTQPGEPPAGQASPSPETPPTSEVVQPPETAIPSPAEAPVLGSAMAWYPIAEAKARAWQPDAFLTLAQGENIVIGIDEYEIQAPFSGELALWKYDFFSPSLGKPYFVEVSQGQVAGALEGELIGLSPEQYVGLKTVTEWKIDSTQAVEIAREELRKKYDLTEYDPEERAAYQWFNMHELQVIEEAFQKVPTMQWEIWWGGYAGHPMYRVRIDATNGMVLKVSSDRD